MDKTRVTLVTAAVVVSFVCIVLAANAVILSSKLNTEKARSRALSAQVTDLRASLSDIAVGYNKQVKIVKELQYSLDAARRETGDVRKEIDILKADNRNLKGRLDGALNALQAVPSVPSNKAGTAKETSIAPAK